MVPREVARMPLESPFSCVLHFLCWWLLSLVDARVIVTWLMFYTHAYMPSFLSLSSYDYIPIFILNYLTHVISIIHCLSSCQHVC